MKCCVRCLLLICCGWLAGLQTLWAGDNVSANADFAERYMHELGSKGEPLEYVTVSPRMIETMTRYAKGGKSGKDAAAKLFGHVKSMRMITLDNGGADYYHQAVGLLRRNANRFSLYQADTLSQERLVHIWVRRRGEAFVELVLISLTNTQKFELVDLTGEMDERFMRKLMKLNKTEKQEN